MIEVHTREELKKALVRHEDEIHVADHKLTIGIVTRPWKFRLIPYAKALGYRLVALKYLGAFDAKFIKR